MISITKTISLRSADLEEKFIHSSGPGGQNVNKVATALQLRFNLRACTYLSDYVKARAESLAGSRLTKDGVIVISANRFRTQDLNRQDAVERLVELLRTATERQAVRRATKPTRGSQRRRMDSKTKRGSLKKLRSTKDF